MKASLGKLALQEQARETSLTYADETSLTTGEWIEDARRVTLGRIFYIDLRVAMKRYARGFGKSDRETLQSDALLWIVARDQVESKLPVGPAGKSPLRRDWLDAGGDCGLTSGAWKVLLTALHGAANSPSEYARLKVAKRELPTDLWTDAESASEGERASMAAYEESWTTDYAPEWSANDLGMAMGLTTNAARALEMAHLGMSHARCAHEWGVGMEGVKKVLQRGRAELKARYHDSPGELIEAVLAAKAALVAIREDAARETILEYRQRPDDADARHEAELAASEYNAYARHLPLEKRALIGALTRLLARTETDTVSVQERAHLLADSIGRQLVAERLREAENVRKGRRGILAGKCAPGTDRPLPPPLPRVWKNTGEDSEIVANRRAIQVRAAERFRRYWLATLCQHSTSAALLALQARAEDRQRWHETQRSLAIAQALDASYSASFKPKPSAHGQAILIADRTQMTYTPAPESEPTE